MVLFSRRRRSSVADAIRRASATTVETIRALARKSSASFARRLSIEELRCKVLDKVKRENINVHPKDREMLVEDELFLRRFETEYSTEKDTNWRKCLPDKVVDVLTWRSDFGVHKLRPEGFPAELYQSELFSFYEQPDEKPLVFLDQAKLRKVSGWNEHIIKFIICQLVRLLPRIGNRQVSLVCDASNIGIANLELGIELSYIIAFYFPGLCDAVYVVDMPWMYRTPFNVMLKVFPERLRSKVKSIDRKSIINQLGRDRLPPLFDGKCAKIELISELTPENAISLDEFTLHNSISPSSTKKFVSEYCK